jgi:hypothetical protein
MGMPWSRRGNTNGADHIESFQTYGQEKVNWIFLVLIILTIAGYDLFRYATGGVKATISSSLYRLSQKYLGVALVIAFAFGVLCCHLFMGVCP